MSEAAAVVAKGAALGSGAACTYTRQARSVCVGRRQSSALGVLRVAGASERPRPPATSKALLSGAGGTEMPTQRRTTVTEQRSQRRHAAGRARTAPRPAEGARYTRTYTASLQRDRRTPGGQAPSSTVAAWTKSSQAHALRPPARNEQRTVGARGAPGRGTARGCSPGRVPQMPTASVARAARADLLAPPRRQSVRIVVSAAARA